ncbi:MAG: hypothetical protein K0R59_1064 [Sphingobacterium sp.]|jgi:hypothetical protein|uniref:hypothetical protein n=1 Tax=Sphingobacterium sp. NGMCC 1.201703 TaxID=3388657 RepID=UPI002A67DC04|nr:hypothetical protein [Sphingobacterium sp.]
MSNFKVRGTEIKIQHCNRDKKDDEYIEIEFTKIYTSKGDLDKFMNSNGSINETLLIETFYQKMIDPNVMNKDDLNI